MAGTTPALHYSSEMCRDCGSVLSVREHAEPEESESELEHRSSRLRSSMVDNQEEVGSLCVACRSVCDRDQVF